MRISVRASYVLAIALVMETSTASVGSPAPRAVSEPEHAGPVVVQVACPTSRGLGVASYPGPAVAVARRFLFAQRGRSREGMAATADRWLRYRVAPRDLAAGFRMTYPKIRPGSEAWRFRTRQPRWLDARFGPIGPYLNARLKLLAAGVQAYSCPHHVIHRLVRAIWWIQVILPRCDCDPDRILDLLVVRRNGRYRVFGLA
jgi:hypothetical protein